MNDQVQAELKKIFNGRFSTSVSTRTNYARGEDTYDPIVIDEKKDPELVAINSDLSSVLVSALDKIPMDQRIIVELKNIEGRSHKEIAEFLGISVTAAKVRLHRAHQKLRQILEEVER